MAINIYWCLIDQNWLAAKSPDLVVGKFFAENLKTNSESIISINRCPATFDELNNTYNIYSLYDYDFTINQHSDGSYGVVSSKFDQEFLERMVVVRDAKYKLFSYREAYVFFTDEDSLEASISLPPFLENNNIMQRCRVLPGRMDVGKWFRNIDFAFFLKPEYDTFRIEKDEIFCYTKFHTKEKINFRQFMWTNRLGDYSDTCQSIFRVRSPLTKLENYYKFFKHKKHILKEVKKNLL